MKNVWEYQRQDNEYEILLRGSRWLAKQLDRLIPGHAEGSQPRLNLRILANPYMFLLCLLLLLLLLNWLLS